MASETVAIRVAVRVEGPMVDEEVKPTQTPSDEVEVASAVER